MALTRNFGLNYFGGTTPGGLDEDGGKFTGQDRIAIDRMLKALATSSRHRHTSDTITDPATPTATLGTDGGLPGGVTYAYCVTFVDADGLESLPSQEVVVSTPDVLEEPDEPFLAEAEGGGSLAAGLYYYALTAIRGEEESVQGGQTSITLDLDASGVVLTLPAPPAGATSFQIWRMNAADVGWTRIAVVGATEGSTYTDTGTVPANTDADDPAQQPPLTNLGVAIYNVQIELDPADIAVVTAPGSRIAAWNIYRTETPTAYPAASLVHHVVDRNDPLDTGDPSLPLITSYSDDGDILLDGVPPLASTQMQIAPYVFDHVDSLPDHTQYPLWYPLVYANQLYVKTASGWLNVGGGGGGSGEVVMFTQDTQSTDWSIPHSFPYPPAVDIVDSDGHRVEADVIHTTGLVTIHGDIPFSGTAHLS